MSVLIHCGNKAVMTSHLLQYLSEATEIAIWEMLGFPQIQDHSRRTGFGGEVVEIPARERVTEQRWIG